ncbi:hypothetical protein BGW41_007203, partial [Actinomortierella wolfii]
ARKVSRAASPDTTVAEISPADLPSPCNKDAVAPSPEPPCSQRVEGQPSIQDPDTSTSSFSGIKNPILPPGGFPGRVLPGPDGAIKGVPATKSAIYNELESLRSDIKRMVARQLALQSEWRCLVEYCRDPRDGSSPYQQHLLAKETEWREQIRLLQVDIHRQQFLINTLLVLLETAPSS